MYEYIDKR